MPRVKLPHSVRTFIRREKARIRRSVSDAADAQKRVAELVAKIRREYNKSKSA